MISHQDQDQEQDQDQILREQVHQKPLKKFPTLQKQLKQELFFFARAFIKEISVA